MSILTEDDILVSRMAPRAVELIANFIEAESWIAVHETKYFWIFI